MFDAQAVHREKLSSTVTPTLTAYEQPMLVRPKLRHLTPVECERLQGFPDGWTEWGLDVNGNHVGMRDRARYRQLGNAVSVPVAEWIARRIRSISGCTTPSSDRPSELSHFTSITGPHFFRRLRQDQK